MGHGGSGLVRTAGEHVNYVSKLQAKHKESSANQTTIEKQVEELEIGKSWRLRALYIYMYIYICIYIYIYMYEYI